MITDGNDDQPATWVEYLVRQPSAAELDRWADNLINRANLVKRFGWDEFRHTWSSGEVSGTALLLGDLNLLATTNDTEESALETWAANLWGIDAGQLDTDTGLERTRAWFYALRQRLTEQSD